MIKTITDIRSTVIVPLVLLCCLGGHLSAQGWSSHPAVNTPVHMGPGMQVMPMVISDGEGGAFIASHNIGLSDQTPTSILIQRLDDEGMAVWPASWILVAGEMDWASSSQKQFYLVADNEGGVFVIWATVTGALRVARVNAAGISAPVLIHDNGEAFAAASDGEGGLVVAWTEDGSENTLRAQKVTSANTMAWAAGGVQVSPHTLRPTSRPNIISDGAGGALITFAQGRSAAPPANAYDLLAQRLSSSGATQWATDGVLVQAGPPSSGYLVTDGAGGGIVVSNFNIFDTVYTSTILAQKIDASGNILWGAGGRLLSNSDPNTHNFLVEDVAPDGAGGAIVVWGATPNANHDIYGQMISSTGDLRWGPAGQPIYISHGLEVDGRVTSDGAGGAIVTWAGTGEAYFTSSNNAIRHMTDIYAQRFTSAGQRVWPHDTMIANAPNSQEHPAIASDGMNGAIIAWQDARTRPLHATNYNDRAEDIYASRIGADGQLLPRPTNAAGWELYE